MTPAVYRARIVLDKQAVIAPVRRRTALSDLRVANGTPDPHNVRMWCLGNEMDGPWQTGFMTAEDYGKTAARTAAAMKMADKDLELVVCGSSGTGMPTFGDWERTVLEHSYDHVDYISCHAYYQELDGDLGSFLASAVDMDFFIDAVIATADHVGHKKRSSKKIDISFDESTARHGEACVIDAVATVDVDCAAVFLVNRDTARAAHVTIDVRSLGPVRVVEALTLADSDVYAKNTLAEQQRVVPRPNPGATVSDGLLTVELPPVSWSAIALGQTALIQTSGH